MKKIFNLLVFIVCLVTNSLVFADKEEYKKIAEELLIVTKADERMDKVLNEMFDLQIKQMPEMGKYQNEIKSFLEKYVGWDKIKDDISEIYAQEFTEQELKEMIAFHKTELGQKILEKTPMLIKKSMNLSVQKLQGNILELQEIIQKKAEEQ